MGAEPVGSTPQALAAHLNKELERWGLLIKARNFRMVCYELHGLVFQRLGGRVSGRPGDYVRGFINSH